VSRYLGLRNPAHSFSRLDPIYGEDIKTSEPRILRVGCRFLAAEARHAASFRARLSPSLGMTNFGRVSGNNYEYGEERILPVVQTLHSGTGAKALKRIMSSVDAFVGLKRQHDDSTCLVLRMT
jgi:hypothetical protein